LTKKQIEDSLLWTSQAVSHQYEQAFYGHMVPDYWAAHRVGYYPYPMRDREQWKAPAQDKKGWIPICGALAV